MVAGHGASPQTPQRRAPRRSAKEQQHCELMGEETCNEDGTDERQGAGS